MSGVRAFRRPCSGMTCTCGKRTDKSATALLIGRNSPGNIRPPLGPEQKVLEPVAGERIHLLPNVPSGHSASREHDRPAARVVQTVTQTGQSPRALHGAHRQRLRPRCPPPGPAWDPWPPKRTCTLRAAPAAGCPPASAATTSSPKRRRDGSPRRSCRFVLPPPAHISSRAPPDLWRGSQTCSPRAGPCRPLCCLPKSPPCDSVRGARRLDWRCVPPSFLQHAICCR